ncbi:hypothetical protein BAnh1_08470 [Bartonella australis AUST/NH1]|uniref:Cell division protein FtsL n=1 Tax=Bartonella australis (strain Aust/NH1) TaxID=1094489 RepID=M1NTT5_BARAA|nr:hypothetical protein [Bartonella australis]AGF74723.1 hypothetical protein BAnh1_08470 [Bartonella australis AUST/NH1]
MVMFRTLDVILVVIMICMAGLTYKVKCDVQKQIGEVHRIEREIAAEKDMVNLFYAEWAVMIEPSRMEKLAKRYQKELNLEMIQPRQVVELRDIPLGWHDQIGELIKQNSFIAGKISPLNNHVSHINRVVQRGAR